MTLMANFSVQVQFMMKNVPHFQNESFVFLTVHIHSLLVVTTVISWIHCVYWGFLS